jgi:hypothetical protein
VPFKKAYVRKTCEKGIRGSIVYNWHENWSLLRGLPPRVWKAYFR